VASNQELPVPWPYRGREFDMVAVLEILFLLICVLLSLRWYLRTPLHRARKNSGVHPTQVAGHAGFGMYTPSNPPLPPHGLHDHGIERNREKETE
jgi:hypothetical protein